MKPRKVTLPSGQTRWVVRFYESGRGTPRRKRTFTRRDDALAFAAEIDRKRRLGDLAESGWAKRPLSDLLEDWWEMYAIPNLSPRTKRDYLRLLELHIEPRLGGTRLRDISVAVVDTFRRDLERAGVKGSQQRQTLAVLQGVFRYAEERERVARNPVRLVRKPSSKRKRAVTALAPSEIEAVRDHMLAQDRIGDACLVSVMGYAGLRPQEVLGLAWDRVRDRTLLVDQKNVDGVLFDGQKTGRKPRTIDLMGPLVADLAQWRLASPDTSGLVFPTRRGEPWAETSYGNWTSRVWAKALRDLKLSGTPYSLRHSYASLRIREGVSIPELAEELGHSPAMTLNTYSHVIEELRGVVRVSAEAQVQRAREGRRRAVS